MAGPNVTPGWVGRITDVRPNPQGYVEVFVEYEFKPTGYIARRSFLFDKDAQRPDVAGRLIEEGRVVAGQAGLVNALKNDINAEVNIT